MSAWSDLGPSAPTRMEVVLIANELLRLAQLARDLATAGPGADLPRAVQTLDKARALLAGPAAPIAEPKCGCPASVVARVRDLGGTCGMGGCPHGGDL